MRCGGRRFAWGEPARWLVTAALFGGGCGRIGFDALTADLEACDAAAGARCGPSSMTGEGGAPLGNGDGAALSSDGSTDTLDSASSATDGSSACSDGQRNGDELGIDCGGSCEPCFGSGTWRAESSLLKAPLAGAGDWFGSYLAVDGVTLVAAAHLEDSASRVIGEGAEDDSALDAGAVYVFRRADQTWAFDGYLKPSNTTADDFFGISVSVSGDTIAVGSYKEDSAARTVNGNQNDESAENAGAAYVFRRGAAGWSQEAYIKASNTDPGDRFGETVAVAGDLLVVGATVEASNASGVNGNEDDNSLINVPAAGFTTAAGAAYVYRRVGTTWTQEAYLKASNPGPRDSFGEAIDTDGATIVVAAPLEESAARSIGGDQLDNSAPRAGAVYVFENRDGQWQQTAYLKPTNMDAGDLFGSWLALDGDVLAVGAMEEASGSSATPEDNSVPVAGAVYIFRRGEAGWTEEAYLKAGFPGMNDRFGARLDLYAGRLAVCATYERSNATGVATEIDDDSLSNAGAVYLFRQENGSWIREAFIKSLNPDAGDLFGRSVALGNGFVVVSAHQEDSASGAGLADDSLMDSGAIYTYLLAP